MGKRKKREAAMLESNRHHASVAADLIDPFSVTAEEIENRLIGLRSRSTEDLSDDMIAIFTDMPKGGYGNMHDNIRRLYRAIVNELMTRKPIRPRPRLEVRRPPRLE